MQYENIEQGITYQVEIDEQTGFREKVISESRNKKLIPTLLINDSKGKNIRTYNLPAIVTNCSNNYGPKQHPEKLIPKLIFNIMNNRPLPIYGKGKNSREWIYVKDHCEALLKVFQKESLENFTILDLIKI